ncbi:TetR/AcrR family transcriptional regulator [Maricaulis sp.]|uniref:TetR/AcrR family transcriptional regulator n=1 Tax=Maricaulis sp. TaxID=1486257 RepID=UPI00260F53D1|nr:TetR/AcrR family transcriptional regulator [Maricaulis sp.]
MSADQPSTRTRLMRAAMVLVAEDGFSAATTAAIARKAGLAEGTLYRHFDSKDALFVAVYSHIKQTLFETVKAGTDASGSVETRFRRFWRGIWNAYSADPVAFAYGQRFSEYPLSRVDSGQVHEGLITHTAALIRDGQAAGQVKPVPDTVLRAFLFSPLVTMLKQGAQGRRWSEAEIDAAIDAAWDSWRIQD